MPQASGPKQSAKENLIFAYDVGDVKNSYTGEPTTNKAGGVHLGFSGGRWGKTTDYPLKGSLPFQLQGDVYQLIDGNNYWGSAADFSPEYNKTYTLSYWYYLSSDYHRGTIVFSENLKEEAVYILQCHLNLMILSVLLEQVLGDMDQ